MRAVAVFPSTKRIDLIDFPPPEAFKAGEVKVRILEVGVCGTDRDICMFRYGVPPAASDFLVLGHESLAEVVEIGSNVSRVRVGDLVVLMVRRPCPHEQCFACRSGRQDFCSTGDFTERGIKQAHGFMAEYVVDDERYCVPVPRGLRGTAILTEPLTIAEKALTQIWQVQQRLPWGPVGEGQKKGSSHKALVLGAGPVGLLGAAALLNAGFETVVYSRESGASAEASFVQEVGGSYVSSSISLDEFLGRVGQIDVIYEATGVAPVSFQMMEALGTNGVMVFTGIPGVKGPIQIDADRIMKNMVLRNQIFLGTVNADRAAYEAAIQDMIVFNERWPKAIPSLITGRSPVESYRDLLLGPKQGIKNILEFDAKAKT